MQKVKPYYGAELNCSYIYTLDFYHMYKELNCVDF